MAQALFCAARPVSGLPAVAADVVPLNEEDGHALTASDLAVKNQRLPEIPREQRWSITLCLVVAGEGRQGAHRQHEGGYRQQHDDTLHEHNLPTQTGLGCTCWLTWAGLTGPALDKGERAMLSPDIRIERKAQFLAQRNLGGELNGKFDNHLADAIQSSSPTERQKAIEATENTPNNA